MGDLLELYIKFMAIDALIGLGIFLLIAVAFLFLVWRDR